jgi:sugar transferase (PEP-CTERM/EpsH1 system associated)
VDIVVAAPRFPFPLDKGDRLTVFNLLKYFSQRHRVSLVCFLEGGQDPRWVKEVEPFCKRVEIVPLRKLRAYLSCLLSLFGRTPFQVRYYSDPTMHHTVRRLIDETRPHLLYAHTIRMGQYIVPYNAYARVLAMQVSMTLNYHRLAQHAPGFFSKIFYLAEYRKLRKFEAAFARRFDRALLISKHDLNAIEQKTPLHNVFFNPHGVDFTHFSPDTSVQKEPNTLIFTGNMGYPPNVDAALYFCREILPLVRRQVPDIKLYIVGADPTPEIESLGRDPFVEVTGRVPDLRVYMNRVEVGIDPLRVGAGLQNKVLEGMAMELPMVITSVANEGIQAVDKENVLIADSPGHFADRIVTLLPDPSQRIRLGTAARDFVVDNWSWEEHFSDLEEMFSSLTKDKLELRENRRKVP